LGRYLRLSLAQACNRLFRLSPPTECLTDRCGFGLGLPSSKLQKTPLLCGARPIHPNNESAIRDGVRQSTDCRNSLGTKYREVNHSLYRALSHTSRHDCTAAEPGIKHGPQRLILCARAAEDKIPFVEQQHWLILRNFAEQHGGRRLHDSPRTRNKQLEYLKQERLSAAHCGRQNDEVGGDFERIEHPSV
jgi:hypothetical protein